jgi:hypothetical protein
MQLQQQRCKRPATAPENAQSCTGWSGTNIAKGSAMDESDIDDHLDMNAGKEWSEMDLLFLHK